MAETQWAGILCIGDPHLCAWAPGYRKDDYPQVILAKLQWALDYADQHRLLPVLLGDLFHVPRDNTNALLTRLIQMLRTPVLTVIGNHDKSEDVLSQQDSLAVLIAAESLIPLADKPWIGSINNIRVALGATNHGQWLSKSIERADLGDPTWVIWFSHHDILFPGYEEAAHVRPMEIAGVDLVVNGHIHRSLPDVVVGQTTWCNPGNIARVSRSNACREHVPGVLRIDIAPEQIIRTRIPVPHQPFDQVFHPDVEEAKPSEGISSFIQGLSSLQRFKTADGEGLRRLIENNLSHFTNERVKQEILTLMQEVLSEESNGN